MFKTAVILFILSLSLFGCLSDDSSNVGQGLSPDNIKLNVSVKLQIGEVTYENLEATIVVSGYDSNNIKTWSEDYPYTGQENELSVKGGYHHYKIEMDKWGIHSERSMTADELWNSRAGGPAPATYVLMGTAPAKKLDYYVWSQEVPDGSFQPQYQIEYEYDTSGKISRYTHYDYNDSGSMEEQRYFGFVYNDTDGRLSKIEEYHTGVATPYMVYSYQYLPDATVSSIQVDYSYGLTSEVNFTYEDQFVKAAYTYSNGQSFEYAYDYTGKNIVSDKTTKWGELCNEGTYTYDNNINPFAHLGYVDYILTNVCANNRLTEDVNYIACFFPESIPISRVYEYDTEGYPSEVITTYKGGGKSQIKYYYQ